MEKQVLLDESFAICETPERLRGIELYEHQKTIVQALIDLENSRMIEVRGHPFSKISLHPALIGTSACVLSEQFGSGKTIELLALIDKQPIPKAFPVHMNAMSCSEYDLSSKHSQSSRFQHEILRTYTGPRALIKPTFVIVGNSVLIQWKNAIAEFTDFNTLTVADQRELRVFQRLFNENKLNSYDIVLVKNGQITGNLEFLGPEYADKSYCMMISAVGHILADRCIARDIWDDFDTIKLPPKTYKLNSLFTIYVSATTRKNQGSRGGTFDSIEDLFSNGLVSLASVTTDKILFSNFNVRNVPEYTERSTAITFINGFRYVFGNPDDNFIRLIGVIGDDATELAEMLNGGAYKTAAKRLQIEKSSGADIFKCVLDQQYEKYRHDQRVLAAIDKFKKLMVGLPRDPERAPTFTDIEAACKALKAGNAPTVRVYSVLLAQAVNEVEVEFKDALIKDGAAITRVIENVKGGSCQICQLPLCEFDTFIVRCCGLILCDICGIEGSHLKKHYNIEAKTYELKGKCANCRHEINPRVDLIFVDKDISVETLLGSYKYEDEPADMQPADVAPVDTQPADTQPVETVDTNRPSNPKLAALLDICRGVIPESREAVPVNIPQLLRGTKDIPQDANIIRKILVFANFDETLKLIEDMMIEHNIVFLRLQGTHKEKANTVKMFKEYGTVMLVNSSQSCAGLNIQFATDIVFFHKIIDDNVAGQVVGRGQRVGRTCNLQLHSLLFYNEAW